MSAAYKVKECPRCGVRHQPGTAARWCADCRTLGYPSRARSSGSRTINPYRFACLVCQRMFDARHPARLYCSDRCKRSTWGRRVIRTAVCAGCGSVFGVRFSQRLAKQPSCSEECRRDIASQRLSDEYASGQRISHLPTGDWRRRRAEGNADVRQYQSPAEAEGQAALCPA